MEYSRIMDLKFLNDLKKQDKEKRQAQNKRYRQKYKELLNLKKTTCISSGKS